MYHNGATVRMPWGYYDVGNVLIETEGRSGWEVAVSLMELALKLQEHLAWPFTEEDMAAFEQMKQTPPRSTIYQAFTDTVEMRDFGHTAAMYIAAYVTGREDGLYFRVTEHGYYAIVPHHDCVGVDKVCPADPDPQNTYGLSDEELADLQQSGE